MSKSNSDAGSERDRSGERPFAYLSPLSVIALSFGYAVVNCKR